MLISELPAQVQGYGSPAIVQGPGWGPASDYLRITLAPLLNGLRVLTYDVRNTGHAPRHPAPNSQATETLVQDLERVRSAHSFDEFVLFGHSHGGFVAMGYAVRHPGLLRGLVLLTPSLDEPGTHPACESLLQRYAQDPLRTEAVRWYRDNPRDLSHLRTDRDLARWVRRRMALNFHDLEAMRRFQGRLIASPLPSIDALRGMPSVRPGWVAEGLRDLEVPTLVIAGRHDLATPPAEGERIHELIPGSRLVVLENSGHNPWAEEPGRFVAALEAFLSEL